MLRREKKTLTNDDDGGAGAGGEEGPVERRHDFQKAQLDAIRVLLSYLLGLDGWRKPSKFQEHFEREQLRDFQQGKGHFNARSKTRTDIYELLSLIKARVATLAPEIRTLLRPIIDRAYAGLPAEATRDNPEDMAAWANVKDDYAASAALGGFYHLYRYASDPGHPHQIIRSALRVMPSRDAERAHMIFEAAYPATAEPIAPGTTLIRGTVTSTLHHLYLYGYDKGSATPYLLAIQRHLVDTRYKTFDALMLRLTTQMRLTAARVYGVKAESEKAAFEAVAKIEQDKRSEQLVETDIATVIKHIDNRVDGDRWFTLTQY